MPAAIAVWTRTSDIEHVYIVGSYFHYSVPGESSDLSPAVILCLYKGLVQGSILYMPFLVTVKRVSARCH